MPAGWHNAPALSRTLNTDCSKESARTHRPPVCVTHTFISSRPTWSREHAKISMTWVFATHRAANACSKPSRGATTRYSQWAHNQRENTAVKPYLGWGRKEGRKNRAKKHGNPCKSRPDTVRHGHRERTL